MFINGLFGGLVGVTGGCILYRTWVSYFVGGMGALIVLITAPLFDKVKVDDPVGATAIHGIGGVWGLIAVGLFAEGIPLSENFNQNGVVFGGEWRFLGVQALAAASFLVWGVVATFVLLYIINIVLPIRLSEHDEILGSDIAEHKLEMLPCSCSNRFTGQLQRNTFATGVDNYGMYRPHYKAENPQSNIPWPEMPTISNPISTRNRFNGTFENHRTIV